MKIFGISVEAELAGQMIYIVNTDEPGFIGALGTRWASTRSTSPPSISAAARQAGEAVALVSVDDPITPQLTAKLHQLPGVRAVIPLSF